MIAKYQTQDNLEETFMNHPANILLVDDKKENLISLESLLKNEDENITYLFANSGEEALKTALKEELALIMLDVQMPGMNGYEVARFLKNNSKTRDIPIIFVTAIDEEMSHMIEGFEAGGVDFLFKPLHPYVTKAKVSAFVRFYRQKKELEKAHRYVLKINQELEERVKERTKELTRINNDLDNFIYTASHDLKAPISNMEGLMHILYDMLSEATKNDEDIFKVRRLIDESIERFKSTLVDLTEVAKAQSEEVSDNSRVEFKEMLEEIKFSIKDLIEESGAIIHEDFSQVPHIVFSRKNLRSIIYNLISNAIKYRAKERVSEVFIKTSTVENFIVLTVKDNGLGIKKEDFEKVFGIFKRLHTHVEGTGVGMSIVKKIVENNGGKIEIQSTVGEGTTFKIFLKEE